MSGQDHMKLLALERARQPGGKAAPKVIAKERPAGQSRQATEINVGR